MAAYIFSYTFENGHWNFHFPETFFLLITVPLKGTPPTNPHSRAKSVKFGRTIWETSFLLTFVHATNEGKGKLRFTIKEVCLCNWDVRNESAGMGDWGRTGLEDQYMELKTVECYKCMMYILSCWQEWHANLWMSECHQCTLYWFKFSYIVIAQCTTSLQRISLFFLFPSLIFKEHIFLRSPKISDSLIWKTSFLIWYV